MVKENEEPISYKDVCRTCAAKNEAMFSLFSFEKIGDKTTTLKDLISLCTEMTISKDDTLPVNVCKKCRQHLIQNYHFNKIVLETQTILRSLYSKSSKASITNTECLQESALKRGVKLGNNVIKDESPKMIICKEVTGKCFTTDNFENTAKQNQIILSRETTKAKTRKNLSPESYKEIKILPKSTVDQKPKPIVIYDNNLSNNMKLHSNPVIIIPSGSTNNTIPSVIDPQIKLSFFNQDNNNIKPLKLSLGNSLQPSIIYPCTKCTKQFISTSYLKTHLERFHGEIGTAVECSLCNIEFVSQEELTEHNLKVHFPSFQPHDKVACDLCKKEYKDRYLLTRHKKKAHLSVDSGFSCNPKCGMAFSTQEGLGAYQKDDCTAAVSTLKTDLVCKLCNGTFVSNRSLALHMKSHNNNICSYCCKVFARESDLLEHVVEHSDQTRPYSCAYCAKSFSAKKVLMRHQRRNHGLSQTVLLCGHCDTVHFGYIGMAEMSRHMQSAHPDIPSDICEIEETSAVEQNMESSKMAGNYIITYYVEEESGITGQSENKTAEECTQNKKDTHWTGTKVTSEYLRTLPWEESLQNNEHNTSCLIEINKENHEECLEESEINTAEELTSVEREEKPADEEKNIGRVNICIDPASGKVTYIDSKGDIVQEKTAVDSGLQSKHEEFGIRSKLPTINCKWCGLGFSKVQFLKKHLQQQHGMRFVVGSSPALEKSRTGKQKSDKIKIAKSVNINLLAGNVKLTDDTEAPYTCKICGKAFQRLVNLEKHSSRHAFGCPCPRCGVETNDRHSLNAHLKTCRDSQAADKLVCPTCGKRLTTAAGWRYHLQTHTDIRRFVCPSCPSRRFLTAANLKAHNRVVHSQIRPHLCVVCGRRFASSDHLRKHIASHAGRRDHLCSICGQGFLQSSHVSQHMWVHTGVKPHRCPHCPNKYTAKCSLTKHLRRNHWEQQRTKRLADEKMHKKLCGQDVDSEILELESVSAIKKYSDNQHEDDTSIIVKSEFIAADDDNSGPRDGALGEDINVEGISSHNIDKSEISVEKIESFQSSSDQLTFEDVNNIQNNSLVRHHVLLHDVIQNQNKTNAAQMSVNMVHDSTYVRHVSLNEIGDAIDVSELTLQNEDDNCENNVVEMSLDSVENDGVENENDNKMTLNDGNMGAGEEMSEQDFEDGVNVVIVDVSGHIDGQHGDVIIDMDGTEEYAIQYEQAEDSDDENNMSHIE